jgi:hypothetical protein
MLGAVCLFGVGGSMISIGGPKAISILLVAKKTVPNMVVMDS